MLRQRPTGNTIKKEIDATVWTGVMHLLPAFLCVIETLMNLPKHELWQGAPHLGHPQLLRL